MGDHVAYLGWTGLSLETLVDASPGGYWPKKRMDWTCAGGVLQTSRTLRKPPRHSSEPRTLGAYHFASHEVCVASLLYESIGIEYATAKLVLLSERQKMIANQTLHFAAVGDVHDHFGEMTRQLHAWSATTGHTLDFVLQVGDLQANRHAADLETMAAPQKFRHLGDFHLLWGRGEALPWPLYFIGGNHEPYGWLDQHPDGAMLMPDLHYLGRAGRVSVGGLRIVGMSGIFSATRHSESRPPVKDILNQSRKHYTSYNDADVVKAAGFGRADILMLHDWPQGVLAGQPASDWSRLKHSGPLGGSRGVADSLADFGSFYGRFLIDTLRPAMVFCGHMHCPHETMLRHSDGTGTWVICLAEVGNRAGGAIRFFELGDGGIEEFTCR